MQVRTLHRTGTGRLALFLVGTGLAAACGGEPLPPEPPPPPPNQAPQTVGAIPPQSVNTGETATVDVAAYFRDPDGGALTYTAATSNPGVVSVAVSGSSLTLVGVADGAATVTVTAADPGGLTAAQSVAVTVQTPNRAPGDGGFDPGPEGEHGPDRRHWTWPSFFRDPDGDALGFSAATSAAGVVSVQMSGSSLALVGVADGTATVTVTASDPGGLTAAQGVAVTVQTPNRPPETVGSIPAQNVNATETATLDVAPYFRDPDGDALTYTAATSNGAVVSAATSGSSLSLAGVAEGTATVTVTARDPGGLTAAQSVAVSVSGARVPDLVFIRVDPQAITVAPGGEDVVEFTIRNTGAAASPATNSRAHESNDATITTSDRVASDDIEVEALAPGATATVRLRISVAAGAAAGSTYFGMCVDPVTSETNTTNNCSSAVRLTISASGNAPRPVGSIPAQSLAPGQTASVGLSSYFTDPNGDPLSYTSSSSNRAVAVASVSGGVLTIRALAQGTATITVTARDPGGLTAAQNVPVTVAASLTRLTDNPTADGGPAWSPDGTRIAFNSIRDGNWEIYVMNVDGSGQARLTNNSTNDFDPAWSPDGTRIAFYSYRDGNWDIYVMNADGTGQVRLTNNAAGDVSPAWSPDGTRIAFNSDRDGNDEIYVMNADGSGPVRLTNYSAIDAAPAWSPDGTRLAYESYRGVYYAIHVMNADGSGQTPLTDSSGSDVSPAWSPDGTRIAFRSDRDGNRELYLMNADGSGQTRLTNYSDHDEEPAWSPDGTRIAFTSYRDGNLDIYVMWVPAGDSQADTQPGDGRTATPAWSVAPFRIVVESVEVSGRRGGERDDG